MQDHQQSVSLPEPIKAKDSSFPKKTTVAGRITRSFFQIFFYLHLFLIAILHLFLIAILHLFPRTVLTFAMGILFIYIGIALSLAFGVVALVSALIQSLYGCWVSPRFEYAIRILQVSIASPPNKIKRMVFSSICIGFLCCCFLLSGIGGARAMENKTNLAPFFIFLILLSLGWTMQFMKNAMLVTISRVKYMQFTGGVEMEIRVAFHDTIKYLTGSVTIGSILVPVIGLFHGFARSMSSIGGDTHEFMFSCVSCYMKIASFLVTCGNRWGFVPIWSYNKGKNLS